MAAVGAVGAVVPRLVTTVHGENVVVRVVVAVVRVVAVVLVVAVVARVVDGVVMLGGGGGGVGTVVTPGTIISPKS